jgi:type II secretory pathway pseudopilin PulG
VTRRGFTLLETALATVIGAMIVLACVGLFTAVNRAETALSRRASEVTEFAMTQRTIRRALLTLVMMPASSRPDPNAEPDPEAARSGADIEPVEMPPGRLVIEPDRAPSIETMILAASADGVRLPPISGMDLGHPQRVEVVLAVPPVPPGLADAGGAVVGDRPGRRPDRCHRGCRRRGLGRGGGPARRVRAAPRRVPRAGDRGLRHHARDEPGRWAGR